ncbi:hypothetical protein B0O99DRAFT_604282 [Bisporella sp. PMI_857]|nr:hypothetical protein B0O99DRAFT_604282 [Bisporella sp. PMI_857]
MIPRQIASARQIQTVVGRAVLAQRRFLHARPVPTWQSDYPKLTEAEDPGQNGGYINPPRVKRQFRDPHGDWWDKQERRNYGEPVHEDNDILGMFSPEEYTWIKPGKGALQVGAFILATLALCGVVAITYPDRPSAPREFESGLERELGGPLATRVRQTQSKDWA